MIPTWMDEIADTPDIGTMKSSFPSALQARCAALLKIAARHSGKYVSQASTPFVQQTAITANLAYTSTWFQAASELRI